MQYFAENLPDFLPVRAGAISLHKYEQVPQLAEVKSRSLSEFLLGSPPVWHDVLTNRIPRLSYYQECEDLINSGTHVFIAGIPQSGKSTLVMQLAAFVNSPELKIIFEAGDVGKAQSLVARLAGRKATVFIDDAANSADVLNVLTKAQHVLVVAADRHFNIETASHRFDKSQFSVVDISDLSQQDMQDIFNAIPRERKPALSLPKMAGGRNPSLYELISFNTRGSQLASRSAQGIKDMEARGIEAHRPVCDDLPCTLLQDARFV